MRRREKAHLALWLALAMACSLGCGGGSQPAEGEPCDLPADCGRLGDALCVDGHCRVFDEASGHGSAKVDLSFGRDMYQAAASGQVHFLAAGLPGGGELACADLLADPDRLVDPALNRLRSQTKYLVFNWSHGGTFFPDNLIQFIRPAESVLVLAEGFSKLDCQGQRTALGCTEAAVIRADETTELTVALTAP